MDASEPRPRRRGFFLHSDTGDHDSGEHDNPEGFNVRRLGPSPSRPAYVTARGSSRGGEPDAGQAHAVVPGLKSANVTGTRRRAHSLR
jgi:hypothetical protein